MDCGLRGKERAEWLADKIPVYGDYAKEAAIVLRHQADEIERLRSGIRRLTELYESEWDADAPILRPAWLEELLTPNV